MKLHTTLHYAKNAFEDGLRKHGFVIEPGPAGDPGPSDLLILWNRYSRDEAHAHRYEKAKATVLIAENAWVGPEEKDKHWFALCRNHHNGAGTWHVGPQPRPHPEPQPWRTTGEHVLVLPQRGMGEEGVRQPKGWLQDVTRRLARATKRPIRVNYHPGIRPHPPIDFRDAWAAVTWASGAGIKAIIAGIPVFHEFPHWIGAPAARLGLDIENPLLGDRDHMLHRLSWAQWTAEEIREGEPFKWLLQ